MHFSSLLHAIHLSFMTLWAGSEEQGIKVEDENTEFLEGEYCQQLLALWTQSVEAMFCVRDRQEIRAKGERNSCENANQISEEKSRMGLEFSLLNALEHGSCLLWLLCKIMSLETSARAISKC